MKHPAIFTTILGKVILFSLLAVSWLAQAPQPAQAQDGYETTVGDCLGVYQDPVNCTAWDVRIEKIIDIHYDRACDGVPDLDGYDTLSATFTIMVSASPPPDEHQPTPPRYDIGIFMAKYGNDASGTGVCYRDYLGPVLTTEPHYDDWNEDGVQDIFEQYPLSDETFNGWWDGDGDECGDMQRDTQVYLTDITVTAACSDSPEDEDSNADISMCVAWNEQADASDCFGCEDAIPAEPAKCSCQPVNFPFTPTALTQMSLEAHQKTRSTDLFLGALGLLLAGSVTGTLLLRRRSRAAGS